MRRPGVGSAVVRLLAIANAAFWLLGMPEMLEVWGREGDGYTVPSYIALPKVTIWIVAGLMVATVALIGVGWWQRRRRATAPKLRVVRIIVAAAHVMWAALMVWSFVLMWQDLWAPDSAAAVGAGVFFEPFLAAVSALTAVVIVRDALAMERPAPAAEAPEGARPPGAGSAVVRAALTAIFAALLWGAAATLRVWSYQQTQYAPGAMNVPWGPFFLIVTFGLSAVLLPLAWWWRRSASPPAHAATWLHTASALQALWAVMVLIAILIDPAALSRQIAFSGYDPGYTMRYAVLGALVAWLHDRDARRCRTVHAEVPVAPAGHVPGLVSEER